MLFFGACDDFILPSARRDGTLSILEIHGKWGLLLESLLAVDFSILNFIAEHLRCEELDTVMVGLTSLGNAGFIWIILGVFMLLSPKQRETGVLVLLALLCSFILCNLLLKNLVERPRPFAYLESIQLLIDMPHDYSFPSGHTSAGFAVATVFFLKKLRGKWAMLLFAMAVAFTRLYLYVHFPSDILGGVVTGILSGYVSVFLVNRWEKWRGLC